ncbi:MAG: hypothetical protein ACRDFB_01505 [Rhabdochlamydiaceae bacterium]
MDLNMNSSRYSALAETLTSVEEVLSSVKNTLESEPVTDELRHSLLDKLDVASRNLSCLEKTASSVHQFAQSYFEELRQKAITLYGKVDDSYLQHEVVVLQDETHDLEDVMHKKDVHSMAQRINGIKEHLIKILNEFRPALQERRALVAAKLVLEKAEAFLRGEETPEVPLDELSLLETEAILEEIADYLTENNRGALRLLMRRLSPIQRKIVSAYLEPKDLLTNLLHDIEGPTHQDIMIAG